MAWIESHSELRMHPKTTRLADVLGVSAVTAVGHLHFLWWWAMDYAPDGDLERFNAREVSVAAGWDGDPEMLLNGLLEAGFLDEDRRLHDWADYGEKLYQRRKKAAERMRMVREKGVTTHADDTCAERAQNVPSACEVTGHDMTCKYSTPLYIPPDPDSPAAEAAESPKDGGQQRRLDDAVGVFDHFKTRINEAIGVLPRVCPTAKILTRLKTFSPEELCRAIDLFTADDWQRRNNAARGAQWFFHSDARIEQFLNSTPRRERHGDDGDSVDPAFGKLPHADFGRVLVPGGGGSGADVQP